VLLVPNRRPPAWIHRLQSHLAHQSDDAFTIDLNLGLPIEPGR
jgi:hypothetical protein